MEEIYITIPCKVIAAEPMYERDFTFSKGVAWDEEKPNRFGYQVRYDKGFTSWQPKDDFETTYRKMTLKEAVIVASGQFVITER